MDSLSLAHKYGIVHGIYIAMFCYVMLFGYSYTSEKSNTVRATGIFYVAAAAYAGFGLHALFFQLNYSSPVTKIFPTALFTFAKFFIPISLACFTYLVSRTVLLQSFRSSYSSETSRWIISFLYALNIASLIGLILIEDQRIAGTLATALYLPHGLAFIFLSYSMFKKTLVNQFMTFIFLACTLWGCYFVWKLYQRELNFSQEFMIIFQFIFAFTFLIFCFLNIRYSYRQIRGLLKAQNDKQFNLARDIFGSLEKNDFYMVYQPKVNIRKNKLDSVEALIRWNHPNLGNIPPNEFINIAEKSGMINSICYWVIDQVVAQNKSWLAQGQEIRTSINFSPKDLRPEIVSYLLTKMNENQVAYSNIIIEVTENSLANADKRTYDALKMLHQHGIRISLDDYGTGYSSLSRINQLDISELKIDRSFIMNIDTNQENRAIVNATLQMGKELNLKVVAEGMENDSILATLASLSCSVVQGYGIARPMTADKFDAWFKESIYRSSAFDETINIRIPKALREKLDTEGG